MATTLEILIGSLTLGFPLWFAFLDRRVFPRMKWMAKGKGIPAWGYTVVVSVSSWLF